MRRSGTNGLRNARLMLTPSSDNGTAMHTGHRRAAAPSIPAIPVALFAPEGHVPILLRTDKSPILSAMRKTINVVKISSTSVGSGLSKCGNEGKAPSSHAKNPPVSIKEITNGARNVFFIRKTITFLL